MSGFKMPCLMTPTLQEYNTAADRLQLIPTTAKRAGGMQFEAILNRSGSSSLEIMNVDLKVSSSLMPVQQSVSADSLVSSLTLQRRQKPTS